MPEPSTSPHDIDSLIAERDRLREELVNLREDVASQRATNSQQEAQLKREVQDLATTAADRHWLERVQNLRFWAVVLAGLLTLGGYWKFNDMISDAAEKAVENRSALVTSLHQEAIDASKRQTQQIVDWKIELRQAVEEIQTEFQSRRSDIDSQVSEVQQLVEDTSTMSEEVGGLQRIVGVLNDEYRKLKERIAKEDASFEFLKETDTADLADRVAAVNQLSEDSSRLNDLITQIEEIEKKIAKIADSFRSIDSNQKRLAQRVEVLGSLVRSGVGGRSLPGGFDPYSGPARPTAFPGPLVNTPNVLGD